MLASNEVLDSGHPSVVVSLGTPSAPSVPSQYPGFWAIRAHNKYNSRSFWPFSHFQFDQLSTVPVRALRLTDGRNMPDDGRSRSWAHLSVQAVTVRVRRTSPQRNGWRLRQSRCGPQAVAVHIAH